MDHTNIWAMNEAQALLQEIKEAALDLGIAPSTVGERAGQGGHFYRRLNEGCRVWPETAQKVRAWISSERARRAQTQEGAT